MRRMKGVFFRRGKCWGKRREFLRIEDGDKEGGEENRDDGNAATALTC